MLVTEEQAQECYCHRTLGMEIQEDEETLLTVGTTCLGSLCMAWRWGMSDVKFDDVKTLRKPDGEFNPPFSNCPEGYEVDSHDCSGYYQASKNKRIIKLGYCGLAGGAT